MGATLALTPDTSWSLPFDQVAETAATAGFTSLGVPRGLANPETESTFERLGLRCHEVMALVITADSEATVAFASKLAGAAGAMGARWVNTVFAPGLDLDMGALRRCAAIFAEVGAGMAVEFSPLGSVPSLTMGLDVVNEVGTDRAGLQIDTWHFAFGPSSWSDLESVPVEQIAYVQFADAPSLGSDDLMTETMTRRALPGTGTLDLDRFATTLRDRGWEGIVSVEVLNPDLASPSVPALIHRAHDTTARYWR